MLRQVVDQDRIADAARRRRAVADGPGDLSEEWLRDGTRVAMPQESGRHLEEDDCRRLAIALRDAGVDRLTAVSNDPLILEDMVYELTPTEEDLAAFSDEFSGINVLLVADPGVEIALLFSTDDYHLIAGPRSFVTSYVGDLRAAKQDFISFVENHFEGMKALLTEVTRYMSWLDDSPKA